MCKEGEGAIIDCPLPPIGRGLLAQGLLLGLCLGGVGASYEVLVIDSELPLCKASALPSELSGPSSVFCFFVCAQRVTGSLPSESDQQLPMVPGSALLCDAAKVQWCQGLSG